MYFHMSKSVGFITLAGVATVFLVASAVFSGCASTGSDPVCMAHQVHSMTPCGMMMNMMGGGHGDHQEEETSQATGSADVTQVGPEEGGISHVHSAPPNDE